MELVLFNAAFLWHLTSSQVPRGTSPVPGKHSGICRKEEGGGERGRRGREEPPCLAARANSVVQTIAPWSISSCQWDITKCRDGKRCGEVALTRREKLSRHSTSLQTLDQKTSKVPSVVCTLDSNFQTTRAKILKKNKKNKPTFYFYNI